MFTAFLVVFSLVSYQHAWENDKSIKDRLDKLEQKHEIQKRRR